MSEYQIVMFRAIDRPLTDKQLEYMDRQSSRAEFTKWEFQVDYHYSSFGGNVEGMLRNGYDIYLCYSNYGSREVRMRLPNGLPFPKSIWSKYINNEGLCWKADKDGKGGILSLAPFMEDGDEDDSELEDYLESTAALREMLIFGDLRALYILWLCCAMDGNQDAEELLEPPVPHGLGSVSERAKELLCLFAVDPLLVDAAASGSPNAVPNASSAELIPSWIGSVAASRRKTIIEQLLSGDPVALKSELLAEIRDRQPAVEWPCELPLRTIADLMEQCEILRQKEQEKQARKAEAKAKREAVAAEKKRAARMKEMQKSPDLWLTKASKLVEQRGTTNYREAASILADLREAIGGSDGDRISRRHAAHLAKKHPTLKMLKSSLKKNRLLD